MHKYAWFLLKLYNSGVKRKAVFLTHRIFAGMIVKLCHIIALLYSLLHTYDHLHLQTLGTYFVWKKEISCILSNSKRSVSMWRGIIMYE